MGTDIFCLLMRNKIRQYTRVFKRNKLEWTTGIFFGTVLIFSGVDLISDVTHKYFSIILVGFLIYCIAKFFQDIPIMNIDSRLLELRILKLWQLKTIIAMKSVILSGVIFIFVLAFRGTISKMDFYQLTVLLLINITINFACFLKSQIKSLTLLMISTVLITSAAYYLDSIVLISIYLVIIIYMFSCMKYFKYDELLPYYHSMVLLNQGLVNSNMDEVVKGQVQLTRQKVKSTFNLMEKYYDKDYWFEFGKEISRASYYHKKIVNASVFSFLITLLTFMYRHPMWINGVVMLGLVFIWDTVLTVLNKSEMINICKGFYYPYSLGDILKQKYFAHLCIILVPFLSSLVIAKHVNFIVMIICILILPIKNVLQNFSSKITAKCIVYCLESIIAIICFVNAI